RARDLARDAPERFPPLVVPVVDAPNAILAALHTRERAVDEHRHPREDSDGNEHLDQGETPLGGTSWSDARHGSCPSPPKGELVGSGGAPGRDVPVGAPVGLARRPPIGSVGSRPPCCGLVTNS